MTSFTAGVGKDRSAGMATVSNPWPNGQTEGQVKKLKLCEAHLYPRATIDLLQPRLLSMF
jgi:transposase